MRSKQSVLRFAYMATVVLTLTGAGFVGSKRLTEQGASSITVEPDGGQSPARFANAMTETVEEPTKITIYVTGAVSNPGLYQIQPGIRIVDAIELAGGATPRADLENLNLAQRIGDGQHVAVPQLPEGKQARTIVLPGPETRSKGESKATGLMEAHPEFETGVQTT